MPTRWFENQFRLKSRSFSWVQFFAGAGIGLLVFLLFMLIKPSVLRYGLIGLALTSGLVYWQKDMVTRKSIILGFLGLLALARLGLLANAAVESYQRPYQWDFYLWYMHGKVAASGLNLYQPENYKMILERVKFPAPPSEDWVSIDIGFHYPPPTIWYFYPLGLMDFSPALATWLIILFVAMMVCIWLLYRLLLSKEGLLGLLVVINLLLWNQTARAVFTHSQTIFILFFWLLLAWRYQNKALGGASLFLSFSTKPLVAVSGLFFLLHGKWRAIAGGILFGGVVVLMTGWTFGWDQFVSYFSDGPVNRIPDYKYSEGSNRSLLAVLIRNVTGPPQGVHPTRLPIFLLLAGGMTVVTAISIWRLRKIGAADLAFFLTIPLAILIYPSTMSHYTLLLGLPLVWLWKLTQDWSTAWKLGTAGLTVIWFGLTPWSTFGVNLSFWLFLQGLAGMAIFASEKLPPGVISDINKPQTQKDEVLE